MNDSLHINVVDIIGNRYGRLIVTSFAFSKKGKAMWNCNCDCGKTCIARSDKLRQGKKVSCGCLEKEEKLEKLVIARSKKISMVQKIDDYEKSLYAILNIAFENNLKDIIEITVETLNGELLNKKYEQDIKNGFEIFQFSKNNGKD